MDNSSRDHAPGEQRQAETDERKLIGELLGALNFILAFYEPGQRHLDTNAWKNAEAGGRAAHAKARAYLDATKLEDRS